MFKIKKIIAEIGSVHDGSFGNACKLIEAAATCGVDAVKFQTHIANAETLKNAPSPSYFKGEPRYDYFQRTAFDKSQYLDLIAYSKEKGVSFISSPFSLESVDFLQEVDVDIYKVPSGEVSNIPLLEHLNQTGKPIILSSGMSDWKELDSAVEVLGQGSGSVSVMQCSSVYPCPPEKVGLNVIVEMLKRYKLPVGFSDHTTGCAAAFAAIAKGASFVEKHFTFSRLMYGSDAANGMEPQEFQSYCDGVRDIFTIIENPVDKNDTSFYSDMKKVFEKSIVAKINIAKGTVLTVEHLAYKKPGDGMSASVYKSVIGRTASRDISCDVQLTEADLL
jgi:N-acetylneuraminate synthase